MATINTPDRFATAVLAAINAEIERVVDEEAEKAAKAIRQRIKGAVGNIALSVLNQYDLSMHGGVLRIMVKNEVID